MSQIAANGDSDIKPTKTPPNPPPPAPKKPQLLKPFTKRTKCDLSRWFWLVLVDGFFAISEEGFNQLCP